MTAIVIDPISTSTTNTGLSSAEAMRRLNECGPNAVAEEHLSPLQRALRHFWAPVPWMLEATIVLQIAIGERVEALMVAALLIFNVALGVFQESRANDALALLKERLSLRVRVKRDGTWKEAPAAELVPGDIVQLSLGAVVPADMQIHAGSMLLDQSMLTGESVPVETGVVATAYAGALVRRGEAIGEVTATGARTYFGRTAELVRVAHVESSEQRAVMGIVRNLTIVNFAIVVGMVAYAHAHAMTAAQIIPLVLTALLAAVPVALPATFTLAATLGAKTLALKGVLLTRLGALHEAAMIDVLCVDKTGTLTENALAVTAICPLIEGGGAVVLQFAAVASSPDGQDPVDSAIREAAAHIKPAVAGLTLRRYVPFDPMRKMAEAVAADAGGNEIRIVKGAPAAIAALAPMSPRAEAELKRLTDAGFRTLAVAAGPETGGLDLVGLIALSDPPRADAEGLLLQLRSLGVRPVMVSGDAAATAATIARKIGLYGPVCPSGAIPETVAPEDFAVYAGVFPDEKFRLVKAFEQGGHAVGMCGDGANDAPALRQAQMGIAVSTATDVAKAAAGIVLTEPGLRGIVVCINEGRSGFQRILTYTLSLLVNKCVTLVVLGVGLIMTGHAVLTPMLQALAMLGGDFVTMSRAADHARPTPYPNRWRVRNLTIAAIPLGLFKLSYCVGMLAFGWYELGLAPGQMRTLTLLTLVYAGQANTYVLRERGRLWSSRPAAIMLAASAGDLALITLLAAGGWLMAPLPGGTIAILLSATVAFALLLDQIKIAVRAHCRID